MAMSNPENTPDRLQLPDGYSISRMVVGGWQLSEGHHSQSLSREATLAGYQDLAEAGFTTFDCADIYTGVEDLLGELVRRRKISGAKYPIQIHTKFVPDLSILPSIRKHHVEHIIDRSLKRLGVDHLDLVQFSWWDYLIPGYVETARWLVEIQQTGKIRHLGVTNFDTVRLQEMISAGVRFSFNQVQYSVLDRRPEKGPEESMTQICNAHDIGLLCYGSLAGGFLTNNYLGSTEPTPPFPNRSLIKYKLIQQEYGDWETVQTLLGVLDQIARKHNVNISNVAHRFVLEQPDVAGVIVGARDGKYLEENLASFAFALDEEDHLNIRRTIDHRGPAGGVFELERVKTSPHFQIMRTNLNQG